MKGGENIALELDAVYQHTFVVSGAAQKKISPKFVFFLPFQEAEEF